MSTTIDAHRDRPPERETLLNPAFIALLLANAAAGYERRTGRPMPISLCFIAAPIVLHATTRNTLPRRVTTKLGPWLEANPLLRAGFASRARATAPAVRAGLRAGLRGEILQLSGELVSGLPPRRRMTVRMSSEVEEILDRAEFAGGWLGLAGPPAGVFGMWRVRP